MSAIVTVSTLPDRVLAFIRACSTAPHGCNGSLFNALALELFKFQFERVPVYQRFCQSRGISPDTVCHWTSIPAVPASAFQQVELSALPAAARNCVFLSSGTTGEARSRHFHSLESLGVYEASLLPWFKHHLLSDVGSAGLRLLCLTPTAQQAPDSSLVYMLDAVSKRIGFENIDFFGSPDRQGGWQLDLRALVGALRGAIKTGAPVMLLGTAFSFVHLLDHLEELGERIELPRGSRVMETGGYKRRSRVLAKGELHALISERLGIPLSHVVSEYGMSELSSQAYDHVATVPVRQQRVFLFPPWARVRIVSPETGREVKDNEVGLVRVVDLANTYSVLAVQTEDLGRRQGEGFEWIGRAPDAEPRGCSLMANGASS
jgi:hypothetical protein